MKAATYRVDQSGIIFKNFNVNFEEHEADIVLAFGEKSMIADENNFNLLKSKFPNAQIVMASTSGEIFQDEVSDNTISIAAITLEKTPYKAIELSANDFTSCTDLGKAVYENLKGDDLKYIFVMADGNDINGSELIKGINYNNSVKVTGGLAGDGDKFEETLVGLNRKPSGVNVAAIGFYGENIKISQGSFGGWEEFGLARKITKSKYNELFEVDDKNILDLYKKYLGDYADELPASALLFPLSLTEKDTEEKVVRTILGLDEDKKSLIFAGDMPENSVVRFMKANTDNLIDAARKAAENAVNLDKEMDPKLAILISCVGRRLVLRNRVEEEIEEIKSTLGNDVPMAGFYSYGEISPIKNDGKCQLHNQTMTITLFDELT